MQLRTSIFSFYLSLKNTPHSDYAFYNSSFQTTLWSVREGRQIGIPYFLKFVSISVSWVLPEGHKTHLFMGTLGPAQKVPLGKFLITNLVISVY